MYIRGLSGRSAKKSIPVLLTSSLIGKSPQVLLLSKL